MTFAEYTEAAARTDGEHSPDYYVHALNAETGEVAALFQKVEHGKPLSLERLEDECGDVLWDLAMLLRKHGLTLEGAARRNNEKLAKRWPDGFKPEVKP